MKREKVVSSNIESIGYEPAAHALEIEFSSGAVYRYQNIHRRMYRELMAAESHGKYFAARIKNMFPYTLVKEGKK